MDEKGELVGERLQSCIHVRNKHNLDTLLKESFTIGSPKGEP